MEDEISYKIIGTAIEVHKTQEGPGLLKGVNESCLCHELVPDFNTSVKNNSLEKRIFLRKAL